MLCNSIRMNACHLETVQIGLKDATKCVSEGNKQRICSFSSNINVVDIFVGWGSVFGFFGSDAIEVELNNNM